MGHLTGVMGGKGAVEGGVKCVSVKVLSGICILFESPRNYWEQCRHEMVLTGLLRRGRYSHIGV